jgi:hypothetical protein
MVRRLAEGLDHAAEGAGEADDEAVAAARRHFRRRGHEAAADGIALAPAADGGDDVRRGDRIAVVEFQAAAQLEVPGQAVGADFPSFQHLRPVVAAAVHADQRVEDHVAEIARDEGGAGDRVEHLQADIDDEAEGPLALLRGRDMGRGGKRAGGAEGLSAGEHGGVLLSRGVVMVSRRACRRRWEVRRH